MVWSSINTGGVILTPQFLLCTVHVTFRVDGNRALCDHLTYNFSISSSCHMSIQREAVRLLMRRTYF